MGIVVVGIDLGGQWRLAVAGNPDGPSCQALELFRPRGKAQRHPAIYQGVLAALAEAYQPAAFIGEQPQPYGKYRRVYASQRQWWSLAEAVAVTHGIEMRGCMPRTMKLRITKDGRADKAKVMRYLRILFPEEEIADEHMADALGLAWLGWNDLRAQRTHDDV